jgi:hypothetical protein
MADTLHHCVYRQRRAVAITRDQYGCVVSCDSCGRIWSYPNSALSDEIALESYVWHASVYPRRAG